MAVDLVSVSPPLRLFLMNIANKKFSSSNIIRNVSFKSLNYKFSVCFLSFVDVEINKNLGQLSTVCALCSITFLNK